MTRLLLNATPFLAIWASTCCAFSARSIIEQHHPYYYDSTMTQQQRRQSQRNINSSRSISRTDTATIVLFLSAGESENINSDFPPEESTEYTGSIDWDAEWKKVVASEGKVADGKERPGKDYYKSEAEIAAIKAANSATEKMVQAGSNVSNALPDVRSLSGDWRFWIAILALVSVGISVLTAPQSISSGLQGDSYYI